jgi:hypothetical protein
MQVGNEQGQGDGSTGANVFVVPIAIGATTTPLSGPLFPTMPELVHPLVWVTGDAETESQEDQDEYLYLKTYMNVQHADFWAGQYVDQAGVAIGTQSDGSGCLPGAGSCANPDTLFSWAGIVAFKVWGGLSFTAGKPVSGQCDNDDLDNSALGDGRVWWDINQSPTPSCSINPGLMARLPDWDPLDNNHHDRPSAFASDAPLGLVRGGTTFPLAPYENDGEYDTWAMPLPLGAAARLTENDDRSVVLEDSADEGLGIEVTGGLTIGPLSVGISGASSISDETVQLTTVREDLSAANGLDMMPEEWTIPNGSGVAALPQTNFVVTSETKNHSDFEPLTISAAFDLHIDIFGGIDIDWSQPFFKKGGEPATSNPDSTDEAGRLRVGEFSDWGNDFTEAGATGRATLSHLPTPDDPSSPHWFASFPATGPSTVPACLADPSVPADPPVPVPGSPGKHPDEDICWVGPTAMSSVDPKTGAVSGNNTLTLPYPLCDPGTMASWLAQYSGDDYTCLSDMLNYLCSTSGGASQQQQWGAFGDIVSKVYTPGTDDSAVEGIHQACVTQELTDLANDGVSESDIKTIWGPFYGALMQLRSCKPDATLDGDAP